MTLACATGVVQAPDAACHRCRGVALSWAMSSRLAARAAARSWSRSSSWRRRSMACCSRWVIFWLRASMSAGAPSPDSRQACSPSASDRRFSSCRTRALSRAARSWAASRSACSEARVTAGPVPPAAGGAASRAWILLEQVAVPVEEGAVDGGGAGDAGDADLGAVGGGAVERGDDALPAAGGVGLPSFPSSPRSAGWPRAGRAVVAGGCHAGASLRVRAGRRGRPACRGRRRGACGSR